MDRLTAWTLCMLLTTGVAVTAQSAAGPATVETLELQVLAGTWFEVATSGSWSHRRCLADTRFEWTYRHERALDVRSACTTAGGEETRHGRLRAGDHAHPGRLAVRYAPAVLAWLPAVWTDYWLLGAGDDGSWLVVGDRRRERLSVLSRRVSLDESALAQAIAAARARGFDVDALAAVPHHQGVPAPVR